MDSRTARRPCNPLETEIEKQIYRQNLSPEDISLRLILESLKRIGEYAADIAEIVLNLVFKEKVSNHAMKLEEDEKPSVESYGTSKEGLALAAARRGFDVYTMGRSLHHSFTDKIEELVPEIDFGMLELLYKDTKAKFRSMGLRNKSTRIELPRIRQILRKAHVPILLTSPSLFTHNEDLPHWVVVTGYGKHGWYLNNPLTMSPHNEIDYEVLRKKLGYHGVRCAVVVCGLTTPSFE